MFENISQLENEVKEFEKNILASRELIDHLNSLIEAINTNSNTFAEGSAYLQQTVTEKSISDADALAKTVSDIRTGNSLAIDELKTSNAALRNIFSDNANEIISSVRDSASSNSELVRSAVAELSENNSQHVKAIHEESAELTNSLASQIDAAVTAVTDRSEKSTLEIHDAVESFRASNLTLQSEIAEHTEQMVRSVKNSSDASATALNNTVSQIINSNEESVKSICKQDSELQTALAANINSLICSVGDKAESDKAAIENAVRTLLDNMQKSMTSLEEEAKVLQDFISNSSTAELGQLNDYIVSAIKEIKDANRALTDELSTDNTSLMSSALLRLDNAVTAYNSKLSQTSQELENCKENLTQKYNEFISRLDATNLDKVYDRLNSIENLIKSKFTLLYAGIGISIILAAVSIFT